jgi:hypothetical protein
MRFRSFRTQCWREIGRKVNPIYRQSGLAAGIVYRIGVHCGSALSEVRHSNGTFAPWHSEPRTLMFLPKPAQE